LKLRYDSDETNHVALLPWSCGFVSAWGVMGREIDSGQGIHRVVGTYFYRGSRLKNRSLESPVKWTTLGTYLRTIALAGHGLVVIASASITDDPGLESRQGIRFWAAVKT
jgi:hypothetical protein